MRSNNRNLLFIVVLLAFASKAECQDALYYSRTETALKNTDAAIADYEDFIKREPDNDNAHLSLINLLVASHRKAEARSACLRFLSKKGIPDRALPETCEKIAPAGDKIIVAPKGTVANLVEQGVVASLIEKISSLSNVGCKFRKQTYESISAKVDVVRGEIWVEGASASRAVIHRTFGLPPRTLPRSPVPEFSSAHKNPNDWHPQRIKYRGVERLGEDEVYRLELRQQTTAWVSPKTGLLARISEDGGRTITEFYDCKIGDNPEGHNLSEGYSGGELLISAMTDAAGLRRAIRWRPTQAASKGATE